VLAVKVDVHVVVVVVVVEGGQDRRRGERRSWLARPVASFLDRHPKTSTAHVAVASLQSYHHTIALLDKVKTVSRMK
jgi:hypothetical protein